MKDQVLLPRSFVQDTSTEICMQASALQHNIKAWRDAAFAGQPGDTALVLETIGSTVTLLVGMREQIVFIRERERQKVTALEKADASTAADGAG